MVYETESLEHVKELLDQTSSSLERYMSMESKSVRIGAGSDSGDYSSWYVTDSEGNEIHIGDTVEVMGSGLKPMKFEVGGFVKSNLYQDPPLWVIKYGSNCNYNPLVLRVIKDSKEPVTD